MPDPLLKQHKVEVRMDSRLDLGKTAFTADFGDGISLEATFASDNGILVDMKGMKKPVFQGWKPVWAEGDHEHRPIHTPVLKGTFKDKTKIVCEFRPRRTKCEAK
jgi:hypothetical protein